MTVGVIFRSDLSPSAPAGLVDELGHTLDRLTGDAWRTSPHQTMGRNDTLHNRVYFSSPYQNIDAFGVFEASDSRTAHLGITRLQAAGWAELFSSTEWLVGPRDLPPDPGRGPHQEGFGFLALWDWNDEWHQASPTERAEYDEECDVAFRYDVSLGIDLFGRFACHAEGGWDHAALWEVPDLTALTAAMGAHETQRDFMFTTSSHYIGRPIPFARLKEHTS